MKKLTRNLKLSHNIINAKIVFDKLTDENKDTFSFYAAQLLLEMNYSPNLTSRTAVDQFEKLDMYKKLSLLSLVFLEKGIPTNNPEQHLNGWHVIESPLVISEKIQKQIDDQLHYMSEKYNVKITI
jgi:hypothetical protein